MAISLKDILTKDIANAKTREFVGEVLPAGTYTGKLLGFTEEETYQFVTLLINGTKYNFFYNYFLRDSQDLDRDVIEWIKSLATIPTDDNTNLLTIANSAVGSSYKVEIYNYVPANGKNAGKQQHAIRFSTKPIRELIAVEEEEISTEDLPF